MAQITLPCGRVVLLDDADLPVVAGYSWHAMRVSQRSERHYARSTVDRKNIYMHRLLLGFPVTTVDHKNNDGLDNRRENLRVATRSQNNANRGTTSSTGYRGVYFHQRMGKFAANIANPSIRVGSKCAHLGYFASAEEAARAYDRAASERWGEFARLNFPALPPALREGSPT